MAEIKWTQGQLDAINHNDGSMIVTAAAGSGKTAVIVARVLRLVKRCDIDRLIIVTFTNAAAQQMRDKIAEGLTKAITDKNTSKEDRENYQKQLLLLPGANICTVHSFCMRLIKENFDKLGIPSSFDILDEARKSLVFNKALEELFDECYEEEAFKELAASFVTSKKDSVEEYVKKFYVASRKTPFPEKWLELVVDSYENYKKSLWYNFFVEDSGEKIQNAVRRYRDYVFEYTDGIEELEKARELVQKDTVSFLDIVKGSSYEEIYKAMSAVSFSNFPTSINKIDTAKNIQGERADFKNEIGSISIPLSAEELESFMRKQTKNVKMFVSLVKRLEEKYLEKKLQSSMLEFDDLEHFAIKLLCDSDGNPTETAIELSNEYDEIIIDEYQDTNDIQETIFNAISKKGENLFMVGDMKQSIYSFRNTAPELFLEKAKAYSNGKGGTRGVLSNNFRSRENILNFVNLVFENIMSAEVGDVAYDKDEKLYFGNKDYKPEEDCSVDLYVSEKVAGVSALEVQTLKIAEIIEDLIENQYVTDKSGEKRKAMYSDICVLSRRSSSPIPQMAQILTKQGIPVCTNEGNSMFLETYEVSLLLSFLRIIDNPYQDIPLVTVLRCPLYNISDHTLTEISKAGRGCFYEKLLKCKDMQELSFFFNDLNTLRNMSRTAKCEEIISHILNNMGVMDFISNMPGGEQRRLNLEYLKTYARNFETDIKKSVYEFIVYIDNLQKFSGDVLSPKYMPENVNAVTFLSMHKSKGLEFPIVILEGLEDPYTMRREPGDVIADKNFGIGFPLLDAENFREIPSPITETIKTYLHKKTISEEIRILYVAMTRAKEKLILMGNAKDEDITRSVSCGVFSREAVEPVYVKSAKNMLEFVLMGCAKLDSFETDKYTKDGLTAHKIKTDIKFNFIRQSFENFEEEEQPEEIRKEFEATENKEVNRRLEYEYDFGSRYYTKYSVSDLKKLEGEEINPYFEKLSPLFEEEMSGAERGTSIHKIFEEIDAKKVTDIESIKEYTKEIPADEIYGFYISEIGERLKKSNEIYKEEPFIISETKDGSEILIQGVIDCYFKDNDKYVIVDFKSDTLTPSNREARIDMYKIQLEYYKKAVKKMHNTENVESYLYFTKTKETIEV